MNWEQIKNILENNEYKEVIRAIFSFESGLTKESEIDELVTIYMDSKMPNFLDEELYFKAIEIERNEQ